MIALRRATQVYIRYDYDLPPKTSPVINVSLRIGKEAYMARKTYTPEQIINDYGK